MRWADRRYSKAFFGVDAGQSRRSGLARHTAGGGFVGAELEAGLRYSISDRWSTNVSVGVGRLMGDEASSPVSKSDTYLTLATGVAYRF
jgi:outer membrane scaffolding protein for murein synthesis (MipA/OmpV family)